MVENLLSGVGKCVVVALAVAALPPPGGAQGVPVKRISTVASRGRPELAESSAAAMSARQPGVFFTINDSGNEPLLFAMDTTGADRGVWRVLRATNVDWESASIGPCGSRKDAGIPTGGPPGCVYIGDTGDNKGSHSSRRIYRVEEPTAMPSGGSGTVLAERVTYVYADGPHDVEAMYVAPNGDMLLITKRALSDASGRLRPALVFRLPANAWSLAGTVIAKLVDSLPIVPGSSPLRMITDASLSSDGRHVAVRTYTQVYVFATDSLTGMVKAAVAPTVCDVVPLGERQGEGVTWADNRGRLLFTSEGKREPIRLADCPPR